MKRHLLYTVVLNAPGSEDCRFIGQMLVSSLLRMFFNRGHRGVPELCEPAFPRGAQLRCVRAVDMHAIAIRASWFPRVRTAIAHPESTPPQAMMAKDRSVDDLHAEIPAYAACPNLAWQRDGFNDAENTQFYPYDATGRQHHPRECLAELDDARP